MDIAGFIDHTLLKPDATEKEIKKLCSEASHYHFKSVCVNPIWVPLCAELLREGTPLVCSVVGFPLGATPLAAAEAQWVVERGAGEVDMVLPSGLLKSGDFRGTLNAVSSVVKSVPGIPVKVILETCLLSQSQKKDGCLIAMDAGASFVKTSTGFSTGGATADDIRLMRKVVGDSVGVKASGGIRTFDKAMEMIEAGASRIGASSSISIVKGNK